MAASDSSGSVRLESNGRPGEGRAIMNKDIDEGVEVETERIDNMVRGGVLPSFDLMKIDVGGAEIKVVRGVTSLEDDELPRKIFCEIHPTVEDFGATKEEDDYKKSYGSCNRREVTRSAEPRGFARWDQSTIAGSVSSPQPHELSLWKETTLVSLAHQGSLPLPL